MKKRVFSLLVFAFISFSVLYSIEIGERVENFTLNDYNGKKHSLTDYKSSKVVVLLFIATQCPVSNAYNERMVQLYKDYSSKNISFIGINSNKQENIEEIKNHANENGIEFTILKDWNNKIADKLNASVTPEVYVLNNNFEILYHGRIDNSRREKDVTSQDLRTALDAILVDKVVDSKETKAFGCTIKRIE